MTTDTFGRTIALVPCPEREAAHDQPVQVQLRYGNYISSEDAAAVLGVTLNTIYNWIAAGIVDRMLVGRRGFIAWPDVQRLIEERKSGNYMKGKYHKGAMRSGSARVA